MKSVIRVLHKDMIDRKGEDTVSNVKYVHVATIEFEGDEFDSVEGMLEYAWRYTNNVVGSWSQKDMKDFEFEGETIVNEDLQDRVTVVAELPVYKGEVFGLRSSMVGDLFLVDDVTYRVASSGFDLVEKREYGRSGL